MFFDNENTLISRFERTVQAFPDHIAVDDAKREITFCELREEALRLKACIPKELGARSPQPIGIFLEESVEAVAAILAILYSGNFYVPLNVFFPKGVREKILASVEPPLIITSVERAGDLIVCGVPVSRMLFAEDGARQTVPDSRVLGYLRLIDSDPIYIMHTSGSTGQPKGVIIQHRSVLEYLRWIGKTFRMDERTVMGCTNSFSFDNSIVELFSMMFFGSRLVLLRGRGAEKDYSLLLHVMNKHRVNFIFWVPSTLKRIANEDRLADQKPGYIDRVLFCGEVMSNKHLNYWRRHYPAATFANLYGPTEITDVCTCYIVDRAFADDDPLPIGHARDNVDILLMTGEGPAKPGESGEILVRGSGLSAGYWKAPEATAEAFVQNPLNDRYPEIVYKTGDIGQLNERGELMFLGRKDTQIKFFGTRVELTEIERMALSLEGIRNVCALYFEERNKIVMAYEADREWSAAEMILALKPHLIAYPTQYIRVDSFPYNTNGKIDRSRLKERIEPQVGP